MARCAEAARERGNDWLGAARGTGPGLDRHAWRYVRAMPAPTRQSECKRPIAADHAISSPAQTPERGEGGKHAGPTPDAVNR